MSSVNRCVGSAGKIMKVEEVRENAQLMHATWWWPWDGMTRKHEYLEPLANVQGRVWQQQKQRLTTKTATTTCSPKCLVAAHIVGFRVVLHVDPMLLVVNGVLVASTHSVSQFFHIWTSRTKVLLRCCLSQCDDMPIACDLFLNSALSSTSRSRIQCSTNTASF